MRSLPIAIVVFLVLAASGVVFADDLSIHLDVVGGLDAWLEGLSFSARIDGNVSLVGDVLHDDGVVWISATGSILGAGFHNLLELMTKGWVLITALGQKDGEAAVVLRSLLYYSSQDSIPLRAGVLFEGVHHTVIQIGKSVSVYENHEECPAL